MKILKIELQNINSLKSDSPIVIDFTSHEFIDTNLFAITGKTGAGKSTILDAITIALYGKVARLQKTSIYEVVSKGSATGFTRLTFENEGVIYSAYRSMSVLTKNLKVRKTKVDEYELSILSGTEKGKIIASSKTELSKAIKEIVKLSFEQFCKSVLIAQGDFASFLNANEAKKGELLQEITGEDIYKEIGYEVQNRLQLEKAKLENLKAKVNTEHLLGEEQKKLLESRSIEIPVIEEQLLSKMEDLTNKVNALNDFEKIQKEEALLKTSFEDLLKLNTECESDFNKLNEIENILPLFSIFDLCDEKNKEKFEIEKKKIENENLLNNKNSDLKITSENESLIQGIYKDKKEQLERWKPLFQKVSTIESQLLSEKNNYDKVIVKTKSKEKLIADNVKVISDLKNFITIKEKEHTERKVKINDKKELNEINENLEEWITLKEQWGNSFEQISILEKKKVKLEIDLKETETSGKSLNKKEKELTEILNATISKKADYSNVEKDLLASFDLLENKRKYLLALKEGKQFASLYSDNINTLSIKVSEKSQHEDYLNLIQEEIEVLNIQQKEAKKSVDDQLKILSLKREILSFTEERKKLKKGKACNLCGATEHPYVEIYSDNTNNIAEENELKVREEKLDDIQLLAQKKLLDKTRVDESLRNVIKEIELLKNQISTYETAFDQLHLKTSITNLKEITEEEGILENELLEIEKSSELIKKQKIEADKLQKEELLLREQSNEMKLNVVSLREKYTALKEQLEELENDINSHQKNITTYKLALNQSIISYNIEISTFNNLVVTLDNLKLECKNYLEEKERYKEKENDLNNKKNLLAEKEGVHLQDIEEFALIQKEVEELKEHIENLKNKRKELIDWKLDIYLEDKRINEEYLVEEKKKNAIVDQRVLLEKEIESFKTTEKLLAENLLKIELKINALKLEIKHFINENNILDSLEDIKQKRIPKEEIEELRNKRKEYQHKEIKLNGQKIQVEKQKQSIEEKVKQLELNIEDYQQLYLDANEEYSSVIEEKGNAKATLAKDAELRKDQSELVIKIEKQNSEYLKWIRLKTALGGTSDSFNKFAQHLTLKNLLVLANRHLNKMSNRYTLKLKPIQFDQNAQPKSFLTFEMIDHHLANMVRSVDTASGGEKFMISLSLALGLSDLSSKNVKIDSLFIDEGFGTLDENTLEDVIYALNTLQSDGKMIGVISHVKSLNERLGTQIKVIKHSAGVSSLEIINN